MDRVGKSDIDRPLSLRSSFRHRRNKKVAASFNDDSRRKQKSRTPKKGQAAC
jgi:hypothetical protein